MLFKNHDLVGNHKMIVMHARTSMVYEDLICYIVELYLTIKAPVAHIR